MNPATLAKPTVTMGSAVRSGPALMQRRRERGISRGLFTEMTDFSLRKLATYEKTRRLPKKVVRPITTALRLLNALSELAGDETALKTWIKTPNTAFDDHTPLALIKAGKADQLWEMIHQVRQGAFA